MLSAVHLRTEYLLNPIGMDEKSPRFGWRVIGGAVQLAYRITVKTESGTPVWDSGLVQSSESQQIVYNGTDLTAKTRYVWSVALQDNAGKMGSPAEAFFETGLFNTPWNAEWITGSDRWSMMAPTQLFRREFNLPAAPVSARLYVTALGVYLPWINGKAVTENVLMPGYTDYHFRVQYQTYDVTSILHDGCNALGIELADGWYKGAITRLWRQGVPAYGDRAALCARLEVHCADGSCVTLLSDSNWQFSADGPRRAADIYHGEVFDARKRIPGWNAPCFDAQGWLQVETIPVVIRTDWNSGAPVLRIEERVPVNITPLEPGCFVVDFGQNLPGREKFTITAPCNTVITCRHGETLRPDGTVYTENLRTARATTTIYADGTIFEYEPEFTFFGFRYLEINGWVGEFTIESVKVFVLHTGMERTGMFECSNPLLNQLYSNAIWGQRGNYLDIPTDCPQRDERHGWTGDAQVFVRAASYNYDIAAFFTKWLEDLNLSRFNNGDYPHFAPRFSRDIDGKGAAGWADAGVICPWVLYSVYQDKRLLERYYPQMLNYIQGLERTSTGLIRSAACYLDWLNMSAETPEDLISTAFFAYSTSLLSKIADVLGKCEDTTALDNLFQRIRHAYQDKFITPEGLLTSQTQTAALLTLQFNLAPAEHRQKIADFLVHDIVVNRGNHLSTGFLGTPYLLHVLSSNDHLAEAYKLLEQATFPGWLYPVTQGATTIWERWNSWTKDDGFGDVAMNSFNHYAYGAVVDWFYGNICGINPGVEGGFQRFVIAPQPGGTLTFASAEYTSPYGKIISSWRKTSDGTEFEFTIPDNTEAVIRLPGSARSITGKPGIHNFKISES